ncbi:hypothetical protein JJD66_12350 [Pseudomonas sp. MF6751]|uniref:hypothetical protein n=1 Tax=Pseudomonas sp. MF6751 TaxID=2797528 RepID=UPI00190B8D39|nr:hypothetical protein [Pseudomonas sp. MF6751]MBK3476877.1 hypothetical protein [Pseudomonas sp. MF6751]
MSELISVCAKDLSGSALSALWAHASSLDVQFPHWIGGDDTDQGPSYCLECAEAEVAAGRAEYVDGGWQQENDGCCHCETCGRLLEYTLTKYGASEEIDHYLSAKLTGPISPEDAFHIAKMLEHDEGNSEAISIAIQAVELIKSAAANATNPVEAVQAPDELFETKSNEA